MDEIKEFITDSWIYLINPSAKIECENGGKYLFFSDDKKLLMKLAKEMILKYNLFNAKVPLSNIPSPSPGFGFVLCVYDSEPRFKDELRVYADEKNIRYRGWKSDEATRKGEYSPEFLRARSRVTEKQ